jgi:hypothetical protein
VSVGAGGGVVVVSEAVSGGDGGGGVVVSVVVWLVAAPSVEGVLEAVPAVSVAVVVASPLSVVLAVQITIGAMLPEPSVGGIGVSAGVELANGFVVSVTSAQMPGVVVGTPFATLKQYGCFVIES